MKIFFVKDLGFLLSQSGNHRWRRNFHNSQSHRIAKPYLLADIGEGITECQIINWFVKPGDRVEQFDRICEVQSDKASVEITSRFDGTIKSLHYETDDMAVVGQPLLDIDIDEVTSKDMSPHLADPENANDKRPEAEQIIIDDVQKIFGSGPQTTQVETCRSGGPPPARSFTPSSEKASDLVTPGVRHMLKKLKVDVGDIRGTGRDGRVLKEDIQRHTFAISLKSGSLDVRQNPTTEDRHLPLTPTQVQMFKVMTRSLTIPHFLYSHTVDFTSLNSLRKRLNASLIGSQSTAARLTPLAFIMKALSQAFTELPTLNSHLITEGDLKNTQFLVKKSHNFGIAVDTAQGLLTPVVKDVQNHSITTLAAEISRLSTLAKEGRLGIEDFKDTTFMISNIGSIGGGVISPIIVSPMVGILGVGRTRAIPAFGINQQGQEEIVKKEEVVLSWSADHRILDGATVAKCAEVVGNLLENVDFLGVTLK